MAVNIGYDDGELLLDEYLIGKKWGRQNKDKDTVIIFDS